MNAPGGLEVWRGGVNAWECDDMGHLNVRFYVARAMEGLVGLAGALGMPSAFRGQTNATLMIKDHHIRFLKEARGRAPLHMIAGVIDMSEAHARVLQLLIHSFTGEIAASFQTVVAHATATEGRPFPWSARARELAQSFKIEIPDRAAPRSLGLQPGSGAASLLEADRLGLIRLGSGAVGVADCDVFGRMRPDCFIGRVSDGIPGLSAKLRSADGKAPLERHGVGGAALEYRVSYSAWPRAGDRFEIRSGLAGLGERTQRLVHWILDPQSGRAWATAEAVAVALDLELRKIIPISAEDHEVLGRRVIPGLTL
jgi:acyl-CoA thioester hydrolase